MLTENKPPAEKTAAAKAARREFTGALMMRTTKMTPLHNLFDSAISRNNHTFFQFSISAFSRLFLPARLTSVLIAEDFQLRSHSFAGYRR